MSLNTRAIALQGIGFDPRTIALQGIFYYLPLDLYQKYVSTVYRIVSLSVVYKTIDKNVVYRVKSSSEINL